MPSYISTQLPAGQADEIFDDAHVGAKPKDAAFQPLFVDRLSSFPASVCQAEHRGDLERKPGRISFAFQEIHKTQFPLDAAGPHAVTEGIQIR